MPGKKVNEKQDSVGMSGKIPESGTPKPAEKPVSLAPLEFEEAQKGLLKVKPDDKGTK